jgi:arylsulfatase A-like enzyme
VQPHYGVVTDRYKLVHFLHPEASTWELFDLATDPRELQSVYDRPDYASIQEELHAELLRLRQELKVVEDLPADLPSAREPKPAAKKPESPPPK